MFPRDQIYFNWVFYYSFQDGCPRLSYTEPLKLAINHDNKQGCHFSWNHGKHRKVGKFNFILES